MLELVQLPAVHVFILFSITSMLPLFTLPYITPMSRGADEQEARLQLSREAAKLREDFHLKTIACMMMLTTVDTKNPA